MRNSLKKTLAILVAGFALGTQLGHGCVSDGHHDHADLNRPSAPLAEVRHEASPADSSITPGGSSIEQR